MTELQELTRWGQAGYSIIVAYGVTWPNGAIAVGWSCTISYRPTGSVIYYDDDPIPYGFHPDDPIAAIRTALRQAGGRWPKMAVQP